jgi:hypothetical protein
VPQSYRMKGLTIELDTAGDPAPFVDLINAA